MTLKDICTSDYFRMGAFFVCITGLGVLLFYGFVQFIKNPASEISKFFTESLHVIVFVAIIALVCFVGYWIIYGIGWVINLIICGL